MTRDRAEITARPPGGRHGEMRFRSVFVTLEPMRALPSGRLAAAAIAAATVVLVVIGGVLLIDSAPAPAEAGSVVNKAQQEMQQPAGKYVALGSSFAAGPGDGPLIGRCGQTLDNYPRQVAKALNMKLVDATCSGAVVQDLLTPTAKRPHRRPQIEAVTPDTDLVTITVGGNDVAYIGRIADTACANIANGLFLPALGKFCESVVWPPDYPMLDGYQSVERSLIDVVSAVRTRAPHARVLLVEYLPVVSVSEAPCEKLPLEPWQVAETQSVGDQLAQATARAAAATGATVVGGAAGAAHTVCSAVPWVRGYGQKMPFHPNTAGKTAMAQEIVRAVR